MVRIRGLEYKGYEGVLATRVVREVNNKLRTGLKNPCR